MPERPLNFRLLFFLLYGLWVSLAGALHAQSSLFPNPTVIPTGNWPAAIYTADLNGDGIPDLIYIDHGATAATSSTHVLLGSSQGVWVHAADLDTAGTSLALGDLTGHGHTDIGWATVDREPGGVGLVLTEHIANNVGNGTFAGVQTLAPFTLSNGAVLGYNTATRVFSSGPTGLFVEDTAHNEAYALQIVNGSLQKSYILFLPDGPGPILETDVDGDGQPDLIINGQSGYTAQIFLSRSLVVSTSQSAPNLRFNASVTSGVRSLLIQDVNRDGRPDLIAEGPNGRIDVYPGNGDGTFQTTSIGGTGTLDGLTGNGGHLIALADLNHDGQLDALTSTPIGVSALLGQGTAYLGLKGIFNAGPGMHTFATADFNGDGNLDLATDSPEGIAILYGNPDGTFQTSQAFAAGAPAQSGALGSFTPSGYLDAAVSINSRQAQLLRGQGDGTFQFFSQPATPSIPQPTTSLTGTPGFFGSIAVGDFDNDGKPDLAVTADGPPAPAGASVPSQGILLQYGRGDGTFAVSPGIVTNLSLGPQSFYGISVAAPGVGLGGVPGLLNLDAGQLWTISNEPSTSYPAATPLAALPSQHPHNLLATGPPAPGRVERHHRPGRRLIEGLPQPGPGLLPLRTRRSCR